MTHPTAVTVTAIIATHNRAHFLPAALDSILAQTYPAHEILVIDDGSTDNTAEVVRHYAARVQYWRMRENKGKAAALNSVIPRARGSHLWIFDDDDVALPDALENHATYLAGHPETDFSYSNEYSYTGNGDIWDRSQWHESKDEPCPADAFFIRQALSMPALLQGMLIPRYCLEQIGGFDERLLRSQDYEFTLRLAHHFRAGCLGQPTFVFRQHEGVRGPVRCRHAASQRNEVWRRFGGMILRQVRDGYPLAAFIPHDPHSPPHPLTPPEQSRALIRRGCIMLHRGLMPEAFADLRDGLASPDRDSVADAGFRHSVSQSFNTDDQRLADTWRFVRKLTRALPTSRARAFRWPALRGASWALRRAMRRRRWRSAMQSIATIVALMMPAL